MAQPTPDDANGVTLPDSPASGHLVASGKRKRDNGDGMDVDVDKADDEGQGDSQGGDQVPEPEEDTARSRELAKAFFEVLRRYGLHPSLTSPAATFARPKRHHPAPSIVSLKESPQADHRHQF